MKGRVGAQARTPTLLVAAPLERYFWGAGHSSGAGGVSIGTRGRCDSAVSLSPACSLAAHWPAGMNSWMNANAGAAVMVSINAETKAAASKTESFLLNNTSLCPPFPHQPGHGIAAVPFCTYLLYVPLARAVWVTNFGEFLFHALG
jgi:hypothetical protein